MADAANKEAAIAKVEQMLRALAEAVRELKALGVSEMEVEARLGPVLDEVEDAFDG